MYNVPPEIAGSVTLIKVSLSVQYIQLEQIYKVPEKSVQVVVIMFVSTIVVMVISGRVTQFVIRRNRKA